MSEAETADAGAEPAAAAPKSKAVPMLLALNTLLIGGVLVFTLTRKSPAPAAAQSAEVTKGAGESSGAGEKGGQIGPTVQLENFVVQLKAVDAERFAHLAIQLEVTTEEDKAKISQLLPRIRDSVIAFLADRTADELRGSEGMLRTKEEILARLQGIVPGRRITNVYITDFIIQ
jgi:flagellar FliL protein